MRLILASASPRRRELLKEIENNFIVLPSTSEENVEERDVKKLVQLLAKEKASEVYERVKNEGVIVLGADTVVSFEGEVLGKPQDEEDARRMLKLLSGRWHEVFTGVCFIWEKEGKVQTLTAVDGTRVKFYPLDDAFITRYIKSGSPMDKAGAYGIQDGGLVEKIEGSYSNVVGLPVELCKKLYNSTIEGMKDD